MKEAAAEVLSLATCSALLAMLFPPAGILMLTASSMIPDADKDADTANPLQMCELEQFGSLYPEQVYSRCSYPPTGVLHLDIPNHSWDIVSPMYMLRKRHNAPAPKEQLLLTLPVHAPTESQLMLPLLPAPPPHTYTLPSSLPMLQFGVLFGSLA
eukprot:scaffold38194_cov16-Tisochrysis_lutea.AAC.1